MTQYWIIVDEQPTGPYTFEQLAELATLTPDTPVWYESLTDWIPAQQVAALATLFGEQAVVECAPVPGMPPIVEEAPVIVDAAETWSQLAPDAREVAAETPARPGNYLVWSILSIILFFTITGIVALIYSIRVNVNYKRQRYAKSVRCSERAQWWIITSVVLGCVMMPFQVLLM